MDEIETLMRLQSGVVSRRQVLTAGGSAHDIRRRVRRREWARVHDGVYVDHTGPLTWQQQAWAAVLFAWPAALCHDSAIRAADGPGRRDRTGTDVIHVAVDRLRGVVAPAGVRVHQLADLDGKTQWHLGPPRVRVEHALLDVAAGARDDVAAIATLGAAVQNRLTTTDRLRTALGTRSRMARRGFIDDLLRDLGEGTCSVLEHGYLTRVERPHGLPSARRQVLASARGPIYRDVEYEEFGLVVELDGRQFHDDPLSRDRDLDRDLDAVIDGRVTTRLGVGHVFGRPCLTAERVGVLLRRRGWTGETVPCPSCTTAGQPRFRATG